MCDLFFYVLEDLFFFFFSPPPFSFLDLANFQMTHFCQGLFIWNEQSCCCKQARPDVTNFVSFCLSASSRRKNELLKEQREAFLMWLFIDFCSFIGFKHIKKKVCTFTNLHIYYCLYHFIDRSWRLVSVASLAQAHRWIFDQTKAYFKLLNALLGSLILYFLIICRLSGINRLKKAPNSFTVNVKSLISVPN